jgi:Ca2+-binding RTX toxin-like protein
MAKGDDPFPGFTNGLDVFDLNDYDLTHPLSAGAIDALGGNDHVDLSDSQPRSDTPFRAGDGDDRIRGSRNPDEIIGGKGNDSLHADPAAGNPEHAGGDDVLSGNAGDDFLYGLYGNETLLGGDGNDYLRGGIDADLLNGGPGDDTLLGGLGQDRLLGGAGEDVIDAGGGPWGGGNFSPDVQTGGSGADTFVFSSSSAFAAIFYGSGVGGGNRDRIVDFDTAEGDRISLAVDADRTNGIGDDAFRFVGKVGANETLDVAEAGYFTRGDSTIIRAETGEEFGPESGFEITLVNFNGALEASDFVL